MKLLHNIVEHYFLQSFIYISSFKLKIISSKPCKVIANSRGLSKAFPIFAAPRTKPDRYRLEQVAIWLKAYHFVHGC